MKTSLQLRIFSCFLMLFPLFLNAQTRDIPTEYLTRNPVTCGMPQAMKAHRDQSKWNPTNSTASRLSPVNCTAPQSIKYINLVVHYLLRNDGSGNFTETDDGHLRVLLIVQDGELKLLIMVC